MFTALGYLLGAFVYTVVFFATARVVCGWLGLCERTQFDYRATKHTRSLNATLHH